MILKLTPNQIKLMVKAKKKLYDLYFLAPFSLILYKLKTILHPYILLAKVVFLSSLNNLYI
jgi:hypothetical protein